jgi:orotidine-5'-phosphate decarboxylase
MIEEPRIIVALDLSSLNAALELAAKLDPRLCRVKVGKELFVAAGPQVVERLMARGFKVFLDLKFHDIPNTVASACQAAARMGVWMLNVHASGGQAMLLAAREALAVSSTRPLMIAVTVLTSLSAHDLQEIGMHGAATDNVLRLARLAKECALDGVVCSAQEAALLRAQIAPPFLLVTPGIRLPAAQKDDQTRVVTPSEAVRAGADYLVIGRPITAAPDPASALSEIDRIIRTEHART